MTPKNELLEREENGLSLEQELERRDRWLEDLQIRYKELQSKYEKLAAKAEPMKPKLKRSMLVYNVSDGEMRGYWVCPICNQVLDYIENSYCHNCGQALDWSDEK